MKVLILGPSGSGKTYVSHALNSLGINAFDGDEINGLSAWYDKQGKKMALPQSAEQAISNHYSFLWDKKFLATFLHKFSAVYIFGGSGNVFDMFDLFDKIYFLKIDPSLQRERLRSSTRPNPKMDISEGEIIIWGNWFEEQAKNKDIPFIDASKTPEQIFAIISK